MRILNLLVVLWGVSAECKFFQSFEFIEPYDYTILRNVYDYFDRIGTECFGLPEETTIIGDIARWFDVIYGRGYYRSWTLEGRIHTALDTNELFQRTIETDFVLAGYYLLDQSTTFSILNGSEIGFADTPSLSTSLSTVINLVDWLGYGIETLHIFGLNYYHEQRSFILENLMVSLREWFLGIYDFINNYYIDLAGSLVGIFLNNDPVVALYKASAFLLDYFLDWFPSILLNDFVRVRDSFFQLIDATNTVPVLNATDTQYNDECWPMYIHKVVSYLQQFERELIFMTVWDPVNILMRCDEDHEAFRDHNNCFLINTIYKNFQKFFDEDLDFLGAIFSSWKYVDETLLAISAITWLGSFAERLFFSLGDIIDFILEIDDIVIELAVQFAQGFGQMLSELLSSILQSAV